MLRSFNESMFNTDENARWHKVARYAWFFLAGFTLVFLIAALPGYLAGFPYGPTRAIQASAELILATKIISSLASLGCAVLSIILAVLLFVRRPHDRMALFLSFYLLLYALIMTGLLEAFLSYWGFSDAIAIIIQTVFTTVPTVILLCIFPNGRVVPGWAKWLVVGSILVIVLISVRPYEDWATFSTVYTQIIGGILGVILFLGMLAQVVRYRKVSSLIEREQTKWVIGGIFVWMIYLAIATLPWFAVQNMPPDQPFPWWVPLTNTSWWLSLIILPLSLSVAILRYRLFDIDVIIRKTLIYGALTIALALVYLGGVVLLQRLFTAIGGGQSPVAIVISTLLIAALFNPLRVRVQDFIDRRFFRSKYNAQQAVAEFSITARDETDLHTLSDELVEVTQETMQPAFLSLWMINPGNNE